MKLDRRRKDLDPHIVRTDKLGLLCCALIILLTTLNGCNEAVKPSNPLNAAIVELNRTGDVEKITGIKNAVGMTPKRVPLSKNEAVDYVERIYAGGKYLVRCEIYAPQIEYVDDLATMVTGHEVGIHCFEGYRHAN